MNDTCSNAIQCDGVKDCTLGSDEAVCSEYSRSAHVFAGFCIANWDGVVDDGGVGVRSPQWGSERTTACKSAHLKMAAFCRCATAGGTGAWPKRPAPRWDSEGEICSFCPLPRPVDLMSFLLLIWPCSDSLCGLSLPIQRIIISYVHHVIFAVHCGYVTLCLCSIYASNPIQSEASFSLTISGRSSPFLHGRVNVRYAHCFSTWLVFQSWPVIGSSSVHCGVPQLLLSRPPDCVPAVLE